MPDLFLTDEEVDAAPPIVGYRILRLLDGKKGEKISIFDVSDSLKKEVWFSSRHLTFGMIFLYSAGLIDFEEPYIVKNVKN